MKRFFKIRRRAISFYLSLIMLSPASLLASDGLIHFQSETGIYEVYLPDGYSLEEKSFRISDKSVAFSTELASIVDQRPYVEKVKSYIVRTEQTFGPPLSKKERHLFIAKDLNSYVDYYDSLGGTVIDRQNDIAHVGQPGGEVRIGYEDPKLGPQEVHIRVLFSEVTKMHQIASADIETMSAPLTQQYFDSFILYNGVSRSPMPLEQGWEKHDSALSLFTAYLPKPVDPYMKSEAVQKNTARAEVLAAEFYDPIWRHRLKYNIYAYVLNGNISTTAARTILNKRHVGKRPPKGEQITYSEDLNDHNVVTGLSTAYRSAGEADASYMDYVDIRAEYRGPFMIVQEVVGSEHLAMSDFVNNIRQTVKFTPRKALRALQTQKSAPEEKKAEEAPEDEPQDDSAEDDSEESEEEATP